MFNLRLINQVRIHATRDPPVTYIQDYMAIHDFDRAMFNVSTGLDHDIMVDRLIENIMTFMTTNGYATITNERHHLVKWKLLVREWVICLESSTYTLNTTTQKCIFHPY